MILIFTKFKTPQAEFKTTSANIAGAFIEIYHRTKFIYKQITLTDEFPIGLCLKISKIL